MNEQNNQDGTPLTFDEILSDKTYQAEFDRRVGQAIETAKKNWQKAAQDEQNEAAKLSKMSDEQKGKYALDKEKARADKAEKELNAYKLKEASKSVAEEEGLPLELLDVIDFSNESAESVNDKIKTIAEQFKKAITNKINERYKEKTPKTVVNVSTNNKNVSRASY